MLHLPTGRVGKRSADHAQLRAVYACPRVTPNCTESPPPREFGIRSNILHRPELGRWAYRGVLAALAVVWAINVYFIFAYGVKFYRYVGPGSEQVGCIF